MKLTPQNVNAVFLDCLFKDGVLREEVKERGVIVEGITLTVGFDPEALKRHAADIDALIAQIPEVFDRGMSFLELCNDRDGQLWTGVHQTMQELMLLGVARKRLAYCAPREMWGNLPGGLPYVIRMPLQNS